MDSQETTNRTVSPLSSSSFEPQGGDAFTLTLQGNSTDTPITMFSDFNAGYEYNVGSMEDSTYGVADDSALNLADFFKRPVILNRTAWGPGALSYGFNPWVTYLSNVRVANRISNYKNLRARMHIRILVNGNPFYYGAMLASYDPLWRNDEFYNITTEFGRYVQSSQLPHVWIDPTNNIGGDLVLPFFWQKNAFDLVNNDVDNAGFLNFDAVALLKHASGTVEPITVTTLGWLEDVSLSGPTSHNMGLIAPQGGDEYGTSSDNSPQVLTMAQRIAPMIKPYIRATQMAMGTALDVMKLFGYSRPTSIEPVNPMRPMFYGNLANVNVTDAAQKLSLDVKQEVTIDPRTVGLTPEDEMGLVTLAKKESFITSFAWPIAAAAGTPLHYHMVQPTQYINNSETVPAKYQTPACWVAAPFTYWRGSMKFRFKIIASNFHKGRLRISYDPTYSKAVDDMSVVRNHIVDIAECKDFCITVGWAQPASYLTIPDFADTNPFGSSVLTPSGISSNGTIKVEVLNELSASSTTVNNDITVLVFVSMCDDFEVQGPNSGRLSTLMYNNPNSTFAFAGLAPEPVDSLSRFEPEAGLDTLNEHTTQPDIPCQQEPECTLGPVLEEDHTPLIYFGERIASWRQVLKRYNYHTATYVGGTAGATTWNATRSNFPNYRGPSAYGVNLTSTNAKYNYSDMTLMNWVIPAYGGWRGAVRFKYALYSRSPNGLGILEVTRSAGKPGWSEQSFNWSTLAGVATASSVPFWFRKYWSHTWAGSQITSTLQNPVAEVEIPYYEPVRFYSARRLNYDVANTEISGHRIDIQPSAVQTMQTYVATGEDFTCFFFLCTPKVYIYDVDLQPSTV